MFIEFTMQSLAISVVAIHVFQDPWMLFVGNATTLLWCVTSTRDLRSVEGDRPIVSADLHSLFVLIVHHGSTATISIHSQYSHLCSFLTLLRN